MTSATTADLASLHQRPVELLQRLLRFDTTNPPGNETACIHFVRDILEAVGCETTLYERMPGRPNLVSRLPGEGSSAPLLLQGHVDVVTTQDQAWTHPPFEGRLVDGVVWGRGALDMKGGVAMLVAAFARARAEGIRLPGDVILAVLADEEAGGDMGARFLAEEHPELFAGVRYALGEFGGFAMTVGGRRFYPIQVAEKQICWLKATVRGPGGHGALINRGGTMARLARFLRDLDRKRLPLHVTPVVRQMVETMADALPRAQGIVLRSLLNPRLADGALRLLGAQGAVFEPMLRNTVNATMLRGGEKINVVPSRIELELDARALPGFGPADLMAELHDAVGRDIELELVRHDAGPPAPNLGLFETLARVIRELDADGIPVPLLQVGVTDARFFAGLGIQTYGFLPMNLPPDFAFTKLIHAADERIPASAVEFGTDAVYRALQRFG
ncbi:MAG: M20/M25/M40 family metallo-hydrolase [Actinomycetota bacterium]|nr:M20/M25/M40 family metallo-hydrolase [Actinomycetota bacterium]